MGGEAKRNTETEMCLWLALKVNRYGDNTVADGTISIAPHEIGF